MVPQLSAAVKDEAVGTSEHSTVISEGNVSTNDGLVVSITLKVADVEDLFPHRSVAANITVTAAEQSLDKPSKLLVHFTSEQLSIAVAPP